MVGPGSGSQPDLREWGTAAHEARRSPHTTFIARGVRVSTSISFDILARDRASRTLDNVGDAADRSADRWRTFGNVARAAGFAVAAGATAAGVAAYKAGQAASDLAETQSKTNAIFGEEGGAALDKWAERADKALGQSKQTALDASATFGTFGKAAKLAGDDLVDFATSNTELAADLASFNNTTPEEAIEALGAAFRGEAEPIRKYGILLDDATLRQEALRLGLIETTKDALTPQQKVLAAQQAILKQTGDAQGDFAKTSDGLANQQRILQAQFQNTQAEIGQVFLPVLVKATSYANDEVVPAVDGMWKAFDRNGIDGLVTKIERLTDRQGELTPILDEAREIADDLGAVFMNSVVPAFEDLSDIVPTLLTPLGATREVLGFMADNADLTKVALEGFVLYMGLAKGATILQNSALGTGVSRLKAYRAGTMSASEAVRGFAGKAKAAAGMGGMALFAASAQSSDQSVRDLGAAAGGALAGFAAGGPIGAAIGAGTGLLVSLSSATDGAAEAQDRLAAANERVIQTLNDQTGAYTQRTRELVASDLAEFGLLAQAKEMGLNLNEMSRAVLKGSEAVERFRLASKDAVPYELLGAFSEGLIPALNEMSGQYRSGQRGWLLMGEAMGDTGLKAAKLRDRVKALAEQVQIMPKQARILVEAKNADESRAKIRRLVDTMDLAPKQVSTLVEILGLEKAGSAVETYRRGTVREMDATGKEVVVETRNISTTLRDGTKDAKPHMIGWQQGLTSALTQGKSLAWSGAIQVGSNLSLGVASGVAANSGAVSTAARQVVTDAILAAKNAGLIESPSRLMHDEVGAMLARGVEEGMKSRKTHLGDAGEDMIEGLVKGIDKGAVSAQRTMNQIESAVDRFGNRVDNLTGRRRNAIQSFQGMATSIFATSEPEVGGFTVDGLLSAQSDQADQAKAVRAAVQRLTDMGLSRSLIKQMQSTGQVEQLLALSTANKDQIRIANSLNNQTQSAYAAAGVTAFGATGGQDALREARRDERLAEKIADAVKDAVGKHAEKFEFRLEGDVLIAAIRKTERNKGK
jgi:hypothetical protein